MTELPARNIWIPGLVTLVLCFSRASCENHDKWDRQFLELKTMMSLLDSKISSIDTKLNNLNVLEYAFKMNTIDNGIKTLNTRIDQMATQIDYIKESVKALPSSPCPQLEQPQNPQHSRSQPPEDGKEAILALKMDDYGKKLMQSHSDMKEAAQEHYQSLGAFFEVVRSGFSKVITKVDSLLSLEGQMSAIVPLVRQLSVTTNFINGEVSNVVTDINELKGGVVNLTSANKAISEFVSEVQNSLSFPVSQLGQATQDAQGLQMDMVKLSSIEEKVVKAATLCNRLLAKESLKSLPAEDREMAQTLKQSLSEIENVTVPLFLSLTYNFENIRANIGDAFTTLANRTQCRSDQNVMLEIVRLKEDVLKHNPGKGSNPEEVFAYCRDSIQDLVISETPNLKMPLQKLLSHLKILAGVSEKSRGSVLDPRDSDETLRILLG